MKKPLRLVVIGGVAAGTKSASKARRDDPSMEITLVTEEKLVSYAGCGLAYYIGGFSTRESLFSRSPETFREKYRIDMRLSHRVERISVYDREVRISILDSGKSFTLPFDRLLIATGASTALPDVPGIDCPGVFPLHRIPDADSIRKYITERGVKHACIIGGGYIGMELPENLGNLGISSTIIERGDNLIASMLDSDLSGKIREHLGEHGIETITGASLNAIIGGKSGVKAVVAGDKEYSCDMAIIVTGVKPNVSLASEARIAIGPTGAIRTDPHMETSARHVYAAGDCAESRHIVSGQPVWIPLGSTANQHGRVAGANIAGGNVSFAGVAGTSIVKVYDLGAGRTGLSEHEARAAGFDPISATIDTLGRATYYPGGQKLTLKMIADRVSGRLLGLQAVGRESVDKALDAAATAITGGLTIDRIVDLDLAYSPPYSRTLGALIVAAQVLEGKR